VTSGSALTACSWETNPSPAYTKEQLRFVSPPDTTTLVSCTKDSDCAKVTDGTSCGLYSSLTDKIKQICGSPRGWWSANQVCADDASSTIGNNVFKCDTTITGQGKVKNLYSCNGINNTSGYAAAADITSTLCGCNDWNYPVNGHGCNGSNAQWVSHALPEAKIKKEACPTAYSYPFDDETSTFVCQSNPDPITSGAITANNINYTITFCPEGKTGR